MSDEAKKLFCVHFTHNDADALGCVLVQEFNRQYQTINIFCNAGDNDPDNKIIEYFKNPENKVPNMLLISDIGITEETATMLENMRDSLKKNQNHDMRLVLVDHHATNRLMEKHDWCFVMEKDEHGVPMSACKFMLNYVLSGEIAPEYVNILKIVIEKISRYDTWEWKRNPSKEMDEEWFNIMIKEFGLENAISEVYNSITPTDLVLSGTVVSRINSYIERRAKAIEKVLQKVALMEYHEYTIGMIIPDDKYFNESMEAVYLAFPIVDIVFGLEPRTRSISFRSNREDLHLGRFAKMFGGGGHPQASGAKPDISTFISFLNDYYTILEKNEEEIDEESESIFAWDLGSSVEVMKIKLDEVLHQKFVHQDVNFTEIVNEHIIPLLKEMLAENNYDICKAALAYLRGALHDFYMDYDIIKNDIDAVEGNVDNYLSKFYLVQQVINTDDESSDDEEMDEDDEEVIINSGDAIVDDGSGSGSIDLDREGLPEDGILYEDLFGEDVKLSEE